MAGCVLKPRAPVIFGTRQLFLERFHTLADPLAEFQRQKVWKERWDEGRNGRLSARGVRTKTGNPLSLAWRNKSINVDPPRLHNFTRYRPLRNGARDGRILVKGRKRLHTDKESDRLAIGGGMNLRCSRSPAP